MDTEHDGTEQEEPALGFKIMLKPGEKSGSMEVLIRWLKGNDTVLYESFCGMLRRKLCDTT